VAVKTTAVESTAVESTAVESAATVEPAAATVEPAAAAVEPAAATVEPAAAAVEPATVMATATATVHLRVGGSDTANNRERRDTCDCKFLHPRLSHGRTPSLLPKNKPVYSPWVGCLP
jgi:hypothetical protein